MSPFFHQTPSEWSLSLISLILCPAFTCSPAFTRAAWSPRPPLSSVAPCSSRPSVTDLSRTQQPFFRSFSRVSAAPSSSLHGPLSSSASGSLPPLIRSSAHSPRLGSLLTTGRTHLIPWLPSYSSGPNLGPASAPHLQLSTGHFLWMKPCRRKFNVFETRCIRQPCPSPGSTFVSGTTVNYHVSFSSAPVFRA